MGRAVSNDRPYPIREAVARFFDGGWWQAKTLRNLGVAVGRERVALFPMPPADPSSEGTPVEHESYVTFDMLANYLRVTKKTMERRYAGGKLCEPDIEGGGGKAHQWKYARIRPFLEAEFARQLPERWPGEAFAFRD